MVAVVAASAVAAVLLLMPRGDKGVEDEVASEDASGGAPAIAALEAPAPRAARMSTPRSRAALAQAKAAKAKVKAAKAAKASRSRLDPEERPELTEHEQALVDKIDVAMDDEALFSLVKLFPEIESSTAPVRVAYVEALGFFGRKALPEITPFLADADESVRDTAANEWTMALDEIENDASRLAIAEKAFAVVSDDDVLESISGVYLGVDEECLAVASLIRIIDGECSDAAREKAKETYSYVTGDEWISRAAAEEKMIRDNEDNNEDNNNENQDDEDQQDQ